MLAKVSPTAAANSASVCPPSRADFQIVWAFGSKNVIANIPAAASWASIAGVAPGTALFAVCIHRTSKTLRSIGANQSAATLSLGKARLTQMGPSARSMHQISDDTPPGRGTAGKGVIPSCRPLLTKKSRNSGGRGVSVMTILCSSNENSDTVGTDPAYT